jgi:hypothetical protein
MATLAPAFSRELHFWQRLMIGIALFIVFCFAQFAMRGFVDYRGAALRVHLHGMLMLTWLALAIVQATLVKRDSIALHRRLGWVSAGVAMLVVFVGSYVGIMATINRTQPPFFTLPYFLAVTQISVLSFAGLVIAAIVQRRRTDWHRRLMAGAMIIIMEPALGRLLPMPLIMPWGEWAVMLVQLGVIAIMMRHDRRSIGNIHPATVIAAAVVVVTHAVIELLAVLPAMERLTTSLAGA